MTDAPPRTPPPETGPHLLLVDDARDIREPLARYLRGHGMRVTLAADAARARAAAEAGAIDLALVDVMMPGEDGLSLTRWLAGRGVPVILLTAMAEEADRILGLELGADDYVVKPFSPRELLARIRAVLRRAPPPAPTIPAGRRRFAGWTYDGAAREAAHDDGRRAALTSHEGRLLDVFLAHPREVLSRARLLDVTQGREAKPYDRAVDNAVARLRRKLEDDPARPRLLVTEWGGGYALAADVEDDA
ncbi:response regulator transcription factor [Jannaschia sp. Os4]|uniref:response regulator n=1 Tax=Jannaschia sp. Os4 TaxID=2807617 RepID=UPI00193AADC7|nr:response regulator transcription factor [Jannaschia sp. Os4]MBM2576355.1 response regulator transcription factor [Jannaschia sp. Os4]